MKKKIITSIMVGMVVLGNQNFQVNAEEIVEKNTIEAKTEDVKEALDEKQDEVSSLAKLMKENMKMRSKEHINMDDSEVDITMEEYLKIKESKLVTEHTESRLETKGYTTTANGVKIHETNFNWNGQLELKNNPKRLIMHHIEASRPGQTIPVTDVHKWHLANGWTGIGYHFYVTKTGHVYRGRPENAYGAHASKHNVDTIGIAVEGRYQSENMPQVQKDAVIKISQYLRRKYKIDTIQKHKDVNATDCPGNKYPFDSIKNSILSYPIDDPKPVIPIKPPVYNQNFTLNYQTSLEGRGWQDVKSNGQMAGTTGQARKINGIKFTMKNAPEGLGIQYRMHIEDQDWSNWINEGMTVGNIEKNRRIEAMEMKLVGEMAKNYSIQYRVHVENIGWMPWKRNGEMAGTTGRAKRIEAIEAKIVSNGNFGVNYKVHGEDYGWQDDKVNGQIGGTTGQERRVEAIKIKLENKPSGLSVRYRTHIENIGWQNWVNENQLAGTVGEKKRAEAIQIELIGNNANKYNIEYRVHVENIGWMPWTRNGNIAGTVGQEKRIEGIEIRIK